MNLYDFINKHKGERCFIACNGPSLNDIPMDKLKGEIIFGLNRGYLKEDMEITYLVTMVKRVVKQYGDEIAKARCKVLFTNLINVPHACPTPFGSDAFQTDLFKPLHRGHTVTYPTMQIAYGMGFSEVYLIGCDHSFSYERTVEDRDHHRAVISTGDDLNHFHPDYFGEGANWLPYSPKMVEKNYSMARRAYEQDGRTLMNVSTLTKLSDRVIMRGSLDDIL